YDGFRQKVTDARQTIRDSLSNDYVRKQFDSQALGIQGRVIINGGRYAGAQNREALANASAARVDSLTNNVRASETLEDFEQRLQELKVEGQSQADLGGANQEWADNHVWKLQSAARAKRIQDITRSDAIEGKRMFDDAMKKGQLHGNDIDKTWNFVQGHLYH